MTHWPSQPKRGGRGASKEWVGGWTMKMQTHANRGEGWGGGHTFTYTFLSPYLDPQQEKGIQKWAEIVGKTAKRLGAVRKDYYWIKRAAKFHKSNIKFWAKTHKHTVSGHNWSRDYVSIYWLWRVGWCKILNVRKIEQMWTKGGPNFGHFMTMQ